MHTVQKKNRKNSARAQDLTFFTAPLNFGVAFIHIVGAKILVSETRDVVGDFLFTYLLQFVACRVKPEKVSFTLCR